MRGLILAELHDQVGEIGFIRRDSSSLERRIQTNFIGSHGLYLDDFRGFLRTDEIHNNAIGFSGVAGPMDDTAGASAGCFELLQIEVEMTKNVLLDLVTGLA